MLLVVSYLLQHVRLHVHFSLPANFRFACPTVKRTAMRAVGLRAKIVTVFVFRRSDKWSTMLDALPVQLSRKVPTTHLWRFIAVRLFVS